MTSSLRNALRRWYSMVLGLMNSRPLLAEKPAHEQAPRPRKGPVPAAATRQPRRANLTAGAPSGSRFKPRRLESAVTVDCRQSRSGTVPGLSINGACARLTRIPDLVRSRSWGGHQRRPCRRWEDCTARLVSWLWASPGSPSSYLAGQRWSSMRASWSVPLRPGVGSRARPTDHDLDRADHQHDHGQDALAPWDLVEEGVDLDGDG